MLFMLIVFILGLLLAFRKFTRSFKSSQKLVEEWNATVKKLKDKSEEKFLIGSRTVLFLMLVISCVYYSLVSSYFNINWITVLCALFFIRSLLRFTKNLKLLDTGILLPKSRLRRIFSSLVDVIFALLVVAGIIFG